MTLVWQVVGVAAVLVVMWVLSGWMEDWLDDDE